MDKEVDLVPARVTREEDGIRQVLVGRDRDGVPLVVHVAQGVPRVAQLPILADRRSAHCLQLGAQLGADLRYELDNARRGENVHAMHAPARGLEFEGERDELPVVRSDELRVLIPAVVGGRLVRENAVASVESMFRRFGADHGPVRGMGRMLLAARDHGVGFVVHGQPELVPRGTLIIRRLHRIDLEKLAS